MDQIQNAPTPEILKSLIANPVAANFNHLEVLEALVQLYPTCSIFHLLLAKAAQSSDSETAAKMLQAAAANVANREVLFKLIHQPKLLVAAKPEKLFPPVQIPQKAEAYKPNASFATVISLSDDNEVLVSEEIVPPIKTDASFTDEKLVSEDHSELVDAETEPKTDASFTGKNLVSEEQLTTVEPGIELKPEEAMAAENDLRVEDVSLNFINTDAQVEQPAELGTEPVLVEGTPEPFSIQEDILQETGPSSTPNTASNEIDEEVFEEIMAIEDMDFKAVKTVLPQKPEFEPQPETQLQPEIKTEEKPAFTIQDKAEKDMLSSIASIDYFTFNNKFGQNQTPSVQEKAASEKVEDKREIVLAKPEPSEQTEQETVSKYHDDKMPYTFMWWLDKTRKEYAGTYQPYVKNQQNEKANTSLSVGPELHQQYIESIFHTKPPHEMAENSLPPVIEPPVKRKEDQLIERFIIQEPHIHPPSSDKLDTENKAKKSSEDGDILVTETLAKIYFDQMLYHKALDTYKKLLLKFPEKNRYFTAQIELIENKIN
ncbi:hypothetical protein [uncultured Mucilaginibacter sp.]|uniref:hypothetical protein n=1 Tax=uncultured Mucilaginibacter sp. TaxID=797541 RepID=UPI0026362FC5|nr:hypothetical protein [uncultured Mucilaginibacter sp.]